MMTDPIADMLTRIRNANTAGLVSTVIPYSTLKENVLKVIKEEGFITRYEIVGEGKKKSLVATLKYTSDKEKVIEHLERVSKPGRRVYVGHDKIKPVRNGLGMAIFSTPKGVVSDSAARKLKVGGEWLCSVW